MSIKFFRESTQAIKWLFIGRKREQFSILKTGWPKSIAGDLSSRDIVIKLRDEWALIVHVRRRNLKLNRRKKWLHKGIILSCSKDTRYHRTCPAGKSSHRSSWASAKMIEFNFWRKFQEKGVLPSLIYRLRKVNQRSFGERILVSCCFLSPL